MNAPNPGPARFSLLGRLKSFRYAFAGLAFMLRTQHNAWVHLVATVAVLAAGLFLRISADDWRWIVVAIFLVWSAEAFNTAVEYALALRRLGSGPSGRGGRRLAQDAGGAGGEAAEQALAAAHRAMLKTPGLQFSFEPLEPPDIPDWLEAFGRFLLWAAPFLKFLFWGGLGLAVLMLAWFIGRETFNLRLPGRKRAAAGAPTDLRPEPSRARALLEDADRLAAEGRFEEAAHLLLFRSIEEFQARDSRLVRPALTSRDIAALEGLPADAKGGFARIVEVVELSFFGGRRIGAGEFADCRGAYEAFAFAGGRR